MSDKCWPFCIILMNHAGAAIEAKYKWRTLECAKHNSHARLLLYVRRRFVATTREIEPNDSIVGQDAESVHALGRNIDSAIRRCGPNKEYFLCCDERLQGLRKRVVLLCHGLVIDSIFYQVTAFVAVHVEFAFEKHTAGQYVFGFQGHQIVFTE